MDKNVTYTKAKEGYHVQFPFDLLQVFKDTFKSAKWLPNERAWLVGPRAEPRLKEFAQVVQERVTAWEELEAAEFSASELAQLQQRLDALNHQIQVRASQIQKDTMSAEAAEELRQALAQKRTELEAMQPQLHKASQDRAAASAALHAEQCRIDDMLALVIPIKQLKGTTLTAFQRNHNAVGATANRLFHEAQSEFSSAKKALAKQGLRLKALDWLADANFNRPDRDAAHLMPATHWYALDKLTDPE